MSNSAWGTPFGKLLIGSSIVAAIAGFAVGTSAKEELVQPLDEAAENVTLPAEADEQQTPSPELAPTPSAEADSTEFVAEPAADQLEMPEQYSAETATETAADTQGVEE